jgi:hypothetical protein
VAELLEGMCCCCQVSSIHKLHMLPGAGLSCSNQLRPHCIQRCKHTAVAAAAAEKQGPCQLCHLLLVCYAKKCNGQLVTVHLPQKIQQPGQHLAGPAWQVHRLVLKPAHCTQPR